MSGQKDLTVDAVAERLRREQESAAAKQRRRDETARELHRASERQCETRAALDALQSQRDDLRRRHQQLTSELEDVQIQHTALERRMAEMRQETLRTQEKAREVGDEIARETRSVEQNMERLRQLDRSLSANLAEIASTMKSLDGTELVRTKQENDRAAAEHERLASVQARLDAEITAMAADETTGIVVEQLIGAMADSNFKVVAVFQDEQQLEIRMQHLTGETVTIALDLAQKMARERDAQPLTRLELVLQREQPDVDACIADTMQIVEKLRKRGIGVSLRVPREQPEAHRRTPEGQTIRTKESS